MECEPEELQFLGVMGIYRFTADILRGPHRPLFVRIAAAFVLPLSALFLLHIAISHALFTHIDTDDMALDASSPGTATQRALLSRLASAFRPWATAIAAGSFPAGSRLVLNWVPR